MTKVEYPADCARLEGELLGTSEWVTIDQKMIDNFAKLTGDHNWIHVDVERAQRELPQGKTMAHGLLTLSLLPALGAQTLQIARRGKGINYGFNRIRFVAPVYCGDRVRLHRSLQKCQPRENSYLLTFSNVIEVEGREQPAMVAENLTLIYEEEKSSPTKDAVH